MTLPQDSRSPYRQTRWLEFENVGSGTIPAWGCVEIVDVYRPEKNSVQTPYGGREVWQVRVPTTDDPCLWAVNSHCAIPPGEYGKPGTEDDPMLALMNEAVVPGDTLGIKAGSCAFHKDGCLAIVEGDYDAPTSTAIIRRKDTCDLPQTIYVKSTGCQSIGETSSENQPQKLESGEFVDDTDADPIEVQDPLKWRYAITGDIYKVERVGGTNRCGSLPSSTSSTYVPTQPYGLKRWVKVGLDQGEGTNCVSCGETAYGNVLKPQTSSGGSGCIQETSDCLIEFINDYGRPIGCSPPETVKIEAEPGEACWHIVATKYIPTTVQGSLPDANCGTDVTATMTFVDGCGGFGGDPPTEAKNPRELKGCAGKTFYATRMWTNCDCEWHITYIEPMYKDLVVGIDMSCGESSCSLDQLVLKEIAVHSCDPTVCVTGPERQIVTSGQLVEVLSDLDTTCTGTTGCVGKGLEKTYVRFCAFCFSDEVDSDTIPFTQKTFLTAVTSNGGGCGESGTPESCAITYQSVTLCGIFCEESTGSTSGITLQSVEVLAPNDAGYCSESGLTVKKRTIYAVCVCDPEDEPLLEFEWKTVYTDFTGPSVGSGGPGEMNCNLTGTSDQILAIKCDDATPPTGEASHTLITGSQVTLLSGVNAESCLEFSGMQVCVLAAGDVATVETLTCSEECPPTGGA